MDDCIFCKIVKGDIPCYKVYEDDAYLAFLDISQFTPGHTLVIPKKHYRFVWDVEDIAGYFDVIKKLSNHYRALGNEYIDTLTFGRLVPHAHVHIVPHNGDDADWQKALMGLEYFHSSEHPALSPDLGNKLAEQFKLN